VLARASGSAPRLAAEPGDLGRAPHPDPAARLTPRPRTRRSCPCPRRLRGFSRGRPVVGAGACSSAFSWPSPAAPRTAEAVGLADRVHAARTLAAPRRRRGGRAPDTAPPHPPHPAAPPCRARRSSRRASVSPDPHAIAIGSVQAFVMPARHALPWRVAGGDLIARSLGYRRSSARRPRARSWRRRASPAARRCSPQGPPRRASRRPSRSAASARGRGSERVAQRAARDHRASVVARARCAGRSPRDGRRRPLRRRTW
jgi:hypothetical protein